MGRPKTQTEFIRNLRVIYDSFKDKDLTWDEFRNQMIDLHDPKKMFDDMGDIELKKARARMNKIRIDKTLHV